MIRIVLADDEAPSLENLTRVLDQNKHDFNLVATARTGKEAVRLTREHRPDVLFLDIEMPGMTGLEAASELLRDAHPPLFVFVTAFHQYAVEAFEANAVDYVLKPAHPDRVLKTLDRVKARLGARPEERQRMEKLEDDLIGRGLLKKILARKRGSKDRRVLDPKDVLFFHAHLSDIIAQTETENFTVSGTLKELSVQLAGRFAFSHKAYLVNLNQVEKMAPLFNGNFEIVLKKLPKERFPLSRRYASEFQKSLAAAAEES